MAFQIQLGSFTIDGANRWEENSPSRVPVETFPRRRGAIVPAAPLKGAKTGRFEFAVCRDSESLLTSYLDSLKAELEKGRGDLFLRDDNRYLKAVKTNFAIVHQANQAPTLWASGYIEFVIADPYWYSDNGEQSSTKSNIASSPYAYSVMNNGGTATPVRIEITALSVNKTGTFKLTNTTTGLYVQWGSGTINATKKLIIDCAGDPFTVTNDGANALSLFTGSKDFLLLAGDTGAALAEGSNSLSYEGPTGVDVKIAWTERWD